MRSNNFFPILLMTTTVLVEFTQGKTLLKSHRSRLQGDYKTEKAVATKSMEHTDEVSKEEGFSKEQHSLSTSASSSASMEHIYHHRRRPSGKVSRSAPSDISASSSVSTSGSSSGSDEQLPAEKGDLGIPEQLMNVRHGVYKGQIAVFVDSQSTEDDDGGRLSKGGSSKSNASGDFLKKHYTRPTTTTTTTTTTTPRSTSPRNFPPKVKVSHQSPARTTKKPKTKRPTKVIQKITTRTTKATTTTTVATTTTRLPIIIRPSSPPAALRHQQPKKDGLENSVMQVPPKYPKSTPTPPKEHNNHSNCLSLGRQCRRHNECCTHHCNWRMGMKCDYQSF